MPHQVKQLTGLLPTCCECRKIRTPKDKWGQMESYLSKHSEAVFSHGYCDSCCQKHIAELDDEKARRQEKA